VAPGAKNPSYATVGKIMTNQNCKHEENERNTYYDSVQNVSGALELDAT
jgi:hypothetical protein